MQCMYINLLICLCHEKNLWTFDRLRARAQQNEATNHALYLLPWLRAAPPPQRNCMWALRLHCACIDNRTPNGIGNAQFN